MTRTTLAPRQAGLARWLYDAPSRPPPRRLRASKPGPAARSRSVAERPAGVATRPDDASRLSDGDLARRGDRVAFGVLYERHADRVYRYILFRVSDADAAADLTQDVFIRAMRALAEIRDADRFGAWLMQIAHRAVLNHWERQGRRAPPLPLAEELDDDAPESAGTSVVAASGENLAEEVMRRLDAESLLAAAAELPDRQRAVLGLRFAAELSLEETAAILGCSEDAAKQLQRRAFQAMRRVLALRGAGGAP